MSTSVNDERSKALRARVFYFLPGITFDEALAEATKYHREHPLEEDGQKADPREHREQVMMPLLRHDVPYSLAGAIVDEMVLGRST